MSRHFDDSVLHIPDEVLGSEYYYDEDSRVEYARIPFSDSHYITSNGDVISYVKEIPKLLKTYKNQHGHHYVDICNNGGKVKSLVHRLVAQAFIPNPSNDPIVRHLDDNPDNNYYKNLAWGTQKDNRADSVKNENDFRVSVYCYEKNKEYRSGADAAEDLKVSRASITHCCKGQASDVKGYHVCYLDEKDEKLKDPNWIKEHVNGNFKPVIGISPDGEECRYGSRKEAAEKIGIPECGISSVLHGTIKHTHGWKFREE